MKHDDQFATIVPERRHMDDLRDRLARAEQDIKNHKENFQSFKADDFGALKSEVHTMRQEFNRKLDELRTMVSELNESMQERTNAINLTMAKWAGGLTVLVAVAQALAKHFL